MDSNRLDCVKISRGRHNGCLLDLEAHKTQNMKKVDLAYNMCSLKLLNRLSEAEKHFTKKKYLGIVKLTAQLYEAGQFRLCEEQLDKLPTKAELLEQLVNKLKGKSVAKTLKLMQEGRTENSLTTAKGLSSLLTHIIIECENGNSEYKILIPNIIEKLNEIIYNTLQ